MIRMEMNLAKKRNPHGEDDEVWQFANVTFAPPTVSNTKINTHIHHFLVYPFIFYSAAVEEADSNIDDWSK